jgi:alpha-beta hydrolase superfamily lysophospholipase
LKAVLPMPLGSYHGLAFIPTLIIHSQYDHIIPLDEGIQLHKASGAKEKELVIIPNANHNDLMMVGMDQYFEAIEKFVFANRTPS